MLGRMGEGMSARALIGLHAPIEPRQVVVGGADAAAQREAVTDRLAALLDDPPAVILTGSCSTALDAAAAAVDLDPGDEVVVPAFTFPTSASAFAARGATLRFADVDPRTGNVDPAEVARLIGPRTRVVVVMHYAGVAVDLEPLAPMIADRGIDLVEDAAHGLFATLDERPLGRVGRFGTLSFHRTKNLSTIEGGALIVNRADDVERATVVIDKGTNRRTFERGDVPAYEWTALGSSWRMPEAAVRLLALELDRAAAGQARRHHIWQRYVDGLGGWAAANRVGLPVVAAGRAHPAHLFFLVLPDAAARPPFMAWCAAAGVATAWHYGSLPASTYGRRIAHPEDACPVAADLASRLVRIPLHPGLSDEDVDRVVEAVTTAPLDL